MNYKIEALLGNTFSSTARKAKEIAKERSVIVEFDFNGILCLVSDKTVLEWLERDYMNAFTMDWKQIGHDCVMEYDADTKIEIYTKKLASAKKQKKEESAYRKKENEERKRFAKTVSGIEIELSDADKWQKQKDLNKDGYGGAVVEYAEGWAKLMQVELLKGKSFPDFAEKTSHKLGFIGITGFQYGCAVSILSECWKYGEQLRKWHNKEYNHKGEGVVNPAILTVTV